LIFPHLRDGWWYDPETKGEISLWQWYEKKVLSKENKSWVGSGATDIYANSVLTGTIDILVSADNLTYFIFLQIIRKKSIQRRMRPMCITSFLKNSPQKQ